MCVLLATNVSVSANVTVMVLDDWTQLCNRCLNGAASTKYVSIPAPTELAASNGQKSARARITADMTQVTTGVQLGEAEAVRASVSKYYGEVIELDRGLLIRL
jgi:hypothetical protein